MSAALLRKVMNRGDNAQTPKRIHDHLMETSKGGLGPLAEEVVMTVHVRRLPILLLPDASRVITRYFGLGEENRIRDVVGRILAVPETTVAAIVANLERDFRPIH